MDEFQFWADQAIHARGSDARDRAQHFQELFQPIAKDFGGLESLPLAEGMELVELTQDTLDDVWKSMEADPAFPEARMKHLLEVTGKV